MPLILEGRKFVGILFVGAERKDAFSESDVRLLYTVAHRASISVDRIRALLNEEQKRWESLVEHLPEGVILLDDKGYMLLVNPKAKEYFLHLGPEITEKRKITHIGGFCLDELLQQGLEKSRELVVKRPEHKIFQISTRKVEITPKTRYTVILIRDVTEQRKAEIKIRSALTGTVYALASAIDMRDPYTAGHQRRVAEIARFIAKEMRLSEERIQGIHIAGLVHDVGKISTPAEILTEPGRLTKIELSLVREHPRVGYEILKKINFPWPIEKIVLQHHERLDGSGYPQGLKGDEILLEARILAVADVVEVIASHRPYRPAQGIDKALKEIEKNKGKLYDPQVVDACIKLFKEKGAKVEQLSQMAIDSEHQNNIDYLKDEVDKKDI